MTVGSGFICASVGVAATAANASAATATAVGRVVREGFMSFSDVLEVVPRKRLATSDTEDERAADAAAHKLVSLPWAITGPVGWPVGEPPGGSSDTASVASGVRRLDEIRRDARAGSAGPAG